MGRSLGEIAQFWEKYPRYFSQIWYFYIQLYVLNGEFLVKRHALKDIISWYYSKNRKPLVLKGARQVGKTYLVDSLAKPLGLDKIVKIDFKEDPTLLQVFSNTRDPVKILDRLGLKIGAKINPHRDLLFFDEIQDCPDALSSLKYFAQDMSQLPVISAGSHMGLVAKESSFPVGKVDFLSMFPLSFSEFVENCSPPLFEAWQAEVDVDDYLHSELVKLFFAYLTTGGLPEIVSRFKDEGLALSSLLDIRRLQNALLQGYEGDFAKYSGTVNANHIHHVFREIPRQLANDHDESVKKFTFTGVIPNQKGFDRIRGPLTWLVKSRLCIKAMIANQSGHPLLGYTKENAFKSYFFDVGLLNCALNIPPEAIITPNLASYKGFIVENFVAQELFAKTDSDLVAWKEGQSEVEFLQTSGVDIIPIEVKAGKRWRRAKSLDTYVKKYHPSKAFLLSLEKPSHKKGAILRRPIYDISRLI